MRIFSSVAAYLNRKDYNVFTVDWEPLTFFPCYLSSLSNTRLVAQCTAQFYAHLTYSGASAYDIHCVGHSLGAHICGMISNHLTHRQHKIIGAYTYIIAYNLIYYCQWRIQREGEKGHAPIGCIVEKYDDNAKKEILTFYILYTLKKKNISSRRMKVLNWTWISCNTLII